MSSYVMYNMANEVVMENKEELKNRTGFMTLLMIQHLLPVNATLWPAHALNVVITPILKSLFAHNAKRQWNNLFKKQAIYDIVKEKQTIKSITITEIVEKAGINRGTFYNHYKSIPEVLNDIEKDLITSFSKRFDKTYEILSFEEKTKVFFRSLTL